MIILRKVVKDVLLDKVIFEQRPKADKKASYVSTFQKRRMAKHKGPAPI